MGQANERPTIQRPLGSGFGARSTASEVIQGIDLKGKVAIVTGGNTGIGLETTRVLAAAGATVIVAARDVEKARKNLSDIPRVEIGTLDMMDPGSIDTFASGFLASGRPLHLLINNAGIMWVPLRRDRRGNESQLATNHLGQFHLTARLWPALVNAKGARVVNISSHGHHFAPFNFEDPNFLQGEYETLQAYGRSKSACNLFTVELDERGKGQQVRAYAVHPGSIGGTELGREAPLELFRKMGFCDAQGNLLPEVAAQLKTIPQGAATTVWCATSPLLNDIGGVYCEDVDIAELVPQDAQLPVSSGVQPYSVDPTHAKRLWELSEALSSVAFHIEQPVHEPGCPPLM